MGETFRQNYEHDEDDSISNGIISYIWLINCIKQNDIIFNNLYITSSSRI